jgi:hypothetical protein
MALFLASAYSLSGQAPANDSPRSAAVTPAAYPLCPPPWKRRTGARDDYLFDACGLFDGEGRVTDGWEVTTHEDGRRSEEHWARGKPNGQIRVWFSGGDSWVGQYDDGELEGRREYWYASGGKSQEAEFHRGELSGVGRSWFRDGSLESIFRSEGGHLVANIEWADDGRVVRSDGDMASLLGSMSLDELRRTNARPVRERPEPLSPGGPLGGRMNPVRCDGPRGELAYLRRLRCADGAAPSFWRLGNVGPGVHGNVVDEYAVECRGVQQSVFLDMYFRGHVERKAVAPFHLK